MTTSRRSERLVDGQALEVWEGARFLMRFPRDPSSYESTRGRDPPRPTAIATPDHDFDRLMQAAKPIAPPERDAFLKDIGAELGRYEVVGPGLLHRIISEVQRRYDIADQRRTTG
jgi:hypothetical protein